MNAKHFSWRRNWATKVKPHLDNELVQQSLDFGMMLLNPNWIRGNPPYLEGLKSGIGAKRKGSLAWYQPIAKCHYIAGFSMAIGVINYPELKWDIISGSAHTVAVGKDSADNDKVVMDILQFAEWSADFSLMSAMIGAGGDLDKLYQRFVGYMVPLLLATRGATVGANDVPPLAQLFVELKSLVGTPQH
jgi:hypothetical protein